MERAGSRADRGYASFHALVIMVFATMAGAYLLRTATKDASTAGDFYQMRSAGVSAAAGMNASLDQFKSDTSNAMDILDAYQADHSKRWLLGGSGATSSANTLAFTGTGQSYSARIVDFDGASGIIKIEAQGSGTGGSSGRVTSVFRLEGLRVPHAAAYATHALFVAGDGRASSAPLIVTGNTYFGGGLSITAGGSDFTGTFKTAAYGTNPLILSGSATFRDEAYFETPVTFASGTATFMGSVGFDDDATLTTGPAMSGTGHTLYANGLLTGSSTINLATNAFVYSEMNANTSRVTGAGSITRLGEMADVSAELGFNPGIEDETDINFAAIPAVKVYNVARMDAALFAYCGRHILPAKTMTIQDWNDIFHGIPGTDRMGYHNLYIALDIDQDLTLLAPDADALPNYVDHAVSHDDDEMYKWFIVRVRANFNVGGHLWKSVGPGYGGDAAYLSNVLFDVESGGQLIDFGGPNVFKGYVNVSGTGSVTYKWGATGRLDGAIHHVSATSGFSVTGPNPMRVSLNQGALDDLALTPGLMTQPTVPTVSGTNPALTDAKLRPRLVGMYY